MTNLVCPHCYGLESAENGLMVPHLRHEFWLGLGPAPLSHRGCSGAGLRGSDPPPLYGQDITGRLPKARCAYDVRWVAMRAHEYDPDPMRRPGFRLQLNQPAFHRNSPQIKWVPATATQPAEVRAFQHPREKVWKVVPDDGTAREAIEAALDWAYPKSRLSEQELEEAGRVRDNSTLDGEGFWGVDVFGDDGGTRAEEDAAAQASRGSLPWVHPVPGSIFAPETPKRRVTKKRARTAKKSGTPKKAAAKPRRTTKSRRAKK